MLSHLYKSPPQSFPAASGGLLDAVWCGALISVFLVMVLAHGAAVFAHALERPAMVAAASVAGHAPASDRPAVRAACAPS
jgi:hypothetical protein